MELIDQHTGKRKGEVGVTIHLLKQGSGERSQSITVHGLSIQELYMKLMFYLKSLEKGNVDLIINTK